MNIVISTTWNSIHLIQAFIDHYRSIGFAQMLIMDFDSGDGTLDILRSTRNEDFVRLMPFPGLAGLDSSALLLQLAKTIYGDQTGCLFCDPDELLVLPPEGLSAFDVIQSSAVISRFNVTARRSAIAASQSVDSVLQALTLRIDKRVTRKISDDVHAKNLKPSWIFTAIPGKVFTRLGQTLSIHDGDHGAVTSDGLSSTVDSLGYLLHFPMRTYAEFEAKVGMYQLDFESNPALPDWYGWQARRWIRIRKAGDLYHEYLDQFVPDEDVRRLVAEGILVEDACGKT